MKHRLPRSGQAPASAFAASNHRLASWVGASLLLLLLPAGAQTLTPTSGLSFGAFLAGSGGTISVSTAGARARTGGVLLVSQGAAAAAAQFLVSGSANAAFSITLPSDNAVTLSDANGHSMALNGFVSAPSSSGTLSGGGTQVLNVGATLTVGSGQAAGSYTGNFSVTVNYP